MIAYIDEDEPRDVHAADCKIWHSDEPCDCFAGGVAAKVAQFDSYAARAS